MAHPRFNRRSFLGGAAAGLAVTPLLSRRAGALPDAIPPRIVFIFTPNGTIKKNWLNWAGQGGEPGQRPLSDADLGPILQPFDAYRDSMIALRGVNMESAYDNPVPKDHWPDHMNQLTGRQCLPRANDTGAIAGISIDQHIANGLTELHGATPFHSIQLGARIRRSAGYLPPQWVISARGPDDPLVPEEDPAQVFNTVFGDLELDEAAATRLRARRGRVFDAVVEELRGAECQLGGDDLDKLEAHLDAIDRLEQSLDVDGSCESPVLQSVDPLDDNQISTIADQQISNLHAMLACGLTRVATLQLGNGRMVHQHLGHDREHHAYSHGNLNGIATSVWEGAQTEIDTFYAEKIVSFIDRLAATPEVDGNSLLDHTLVVWCHEQSTGSHLRRDMPYVIVGGSQSQLELGRAIHAGGDNGHRDVTHNGLLITLANAMGVQTESFGDPAHSNGPLKML